MSTDCDHACAAHYPQASFFCALLQTPHDNIVGFIAPDIIVFPVIYII